MAVLISPYFSQKKAELGVRVSAGSTLIKSLPLYVVGYASNPLNIDDSFE